MISTGTILVITIVVICFGKIVFEFANGIHRANFGRTLQAKLIIYSVILLCLVFTQSRVLTNEKAESIGTYLFTTDEHYLEYDITDINEFYVTPFSNETELDYMASTGETITVGDQLLEVKDQDGQVIYKNTGCKVVVVKE